MGEIEVSLTSRYLEFGSLHQNWMEVKLKQRGSVSGIVRKGKRVSKASLCCVQVVTTPSPGIGLENLVKFGMQLRVFLQTRGKVGSFLRMMIFSSVQQVHGVSGHIPHCTHIFHLIIDKKLFIALYLSLRSRHFFYLDYEYFKQPGTSASLRSLFNY